MRTELPDLRQRVAGRVRGLRAARRLPLGALAARSGVSRSMISRIERGEVSATAVVLERLAHGLGVVLGALFEAPAAARPAAPVVRRADQPVWRDPGSGYLRRAVSPPGVAQPMQITEVVFPAGGRVAFDSAERATRVYQQIWVLAGTIDFTAGAERHRLRQGDCLALVLDRPTVFHNPTRRAAGSAGR